MKKFFTQTSVFILFLFVMPFVGMAQVASDGDYRSAVATGNWSDVTTWQVRTGGLWAAAGSLPTTTNNVYIQSGHTITVDANAFCQDFHLNSTATAGAITVNTGITLQVNRKIRNYTGATAITTGVDGVFYTQTNTASFTTGITTTGTGKIQFVYGGGNITNSGEWGANITSWNAEFAPSVGGTTGILGTSFKAGVINIISGTVSIGTTDIRPDGGSGGTGTLTVGSGATLRFTGSGNLQRSSTAGATSHFGTLTINGTLEYSGTTVGSIGAPTINFNGNVVYSSNAQTLVTKGSNSGGIDPTTYTNLLFNGGSSSTAKTITLPTTVNGKLTFASNGTHGITFTGSGSLIYGPSSTLEYAMTNGTARIIIPEWPGTSSPQNVTLINTNANCALSLPASTNRTITGALTLNAGTLTINAGNTITMANNSSILLTSGGISLSTGTIAMGTSATDVVNVTINGNVSSGGELPGSPLGLVNLTINPGFVYTHGGSRTINNIVNNGQIVMTPTTSMTTTVKGTIAGSGIYSTRMSTSATAPSTLHYAASFTFTGPGPVGTLNMKQVADSNHLRSITLNSAGGLIIGNPIIVDTTLTLTNGVLTNAGNLTLGSNVRINRGAGSLSAAPTFGTSIFNLIYNDVVPTTTGFEMPTSSSVIKSLSINNAAGVTLNSSPTINDTLKLLLGNLTIPATQTLRISSGLDILGAPFSSAKYIISGLSGANTGKLRIDNITTAKLFPIGTATNYLPVTVTPTSAMDYEVSVFTGATANGLPTGTALTAAQKDRLVDAVWTIDRMNGTGNCDVQTNWESTLEGAAFSAFNNTSIGLARHNGTAWDLFIGTGDNTANTATATFANFSPFLVGEVGGVLPVSLKSVSASIKAAGIDINWKVENESSILKYEIEKSKNGFDFTSIGTVDAVNKSNYNFTDASMLTGVFYYRIKMISTNGSYKYSYIISVKQSNNSDITIYPNPVANTLIINGLKNSNIIKIVNSAGQIVLQQNANANSLSMDVSTLKTGIYAILIASENEKITSKTFIKE